MRKIYSSLLFFFFLSFCSGKLIAQISTYTFAQSNGTYVENTDPGRVILGTTANDDQVFNNNTAGQTAPQTNTGFPIGFNFTYNGIVYDKFAVSTNGWIVLGTGTFQIAGSGNYTALSYTGPVGYVSAIAALARDLQGQTGSELSYQTLGTAPNRVLVIQWKTYRRFLGTGQDYNFQIRLNETTNAVQFRYGNFVESSATSGAPQVGLRGNTNADFNNRTGLWASSTAGAANTASMTLSTAAGGTPTAGLTYTFAPLAGPFLVASTTAIVTEGCAPANGAIDAGETVTVSFCVRNTGTDPTVNLVGTLQATGGVTAPGGPQNYGVVVNNGPAVCRDFTFTSSGLCGQTITATIQFQDGATNLGSLTYTFTLGNQIIALNQNFDAVVAPALPAGWVTSQPTNLPGAPPWVTSNSGTPAPPAASAPNSIFSTDPANILDNIIETPSIAITSASAQVTFQNNWALESGFDGGVLEISIAGAPYVDIVTAGGSFVTGGYNGTISAAFGNPIGGRAAWTNSSAGFVTTTANLPAAANGQSIKLRFRMGSDNSFSSVGWRVDDVKVINGYSCCTTCTITCPANITVSNTLNQCGAIVNYPAPTSSGVCGPITSTPASGSFFPVGLTTVTTTSANGGGFCSFTVRVNDTQLPTVTCPANIVRNNDPGQCGAVVTWPTPVATDNCPGFVVTSSPASGSFFPKGTTPVTVTVRDASNNSTTCTFTVTVNDTENPIFGSLSPYPERLYYKFDGTGTTVPNLATAPPAGTANATLNGLTQGSTGKCGAALVGTGATNQNLNTGWATNMTGSWTISFWLGPNQIDQNPSYLFGDINAGSFRAFYGGAAGANNMLLRGGSGDVLITGVNPAATFITVVYNGTNTVVYKNGGSPQTYAVTFANTGAGPFLVGGYSTLASMNGRLDEFAMYSRALNATEVLNLFNACPTSATSCPTPIVVSNTTGQCGAIVNYTTPVGTDNCPGSTTSQIAGLASGAFFPVGTTTNTFRVVDASGNSSLCSFTVRVNDTQPPAVTCPANITVSTPIGSCTAVVNYTPTATDNCTTVSVVSSPVSGSVFALGTSTVTVTATDAVGNTSVCTFTVTVNDGQLPVISSQPVNTPACVGTNAVFKVTSSNVLNYQWQAWNGTAWVNIAGANSATYTVNSVTQAMNTNTFRVILTGLCTTVTSNIATLIVNPLPTVQINPSIPPQLIPGQTLNLGTTVNPGGGTFVWYKNGQVIGGATTASLNGLTVNDIGTYKVVYTDANGCVMTSADLVVSGMNNGNLWVYPNPNRGQFQVRYFNGLNENVTVNVYDEKGSKVYQRAYTTSTAYSQMNVNISRMPAGKYLVEVVNAGGTRVGAKWVVVQSQ